MITRLVKAAVLAAAMLVPATSINASTVANISGSDTRLRVLAAPTLTSVFDVELGEGARQTVTNSGTVRWFFPIVGGTLDHSGIATIDHVGSVSLSTGGATNTINNFRISLDTNTGLGTLLANVNGGDGFFPVFDLAIRPNEAFDVSFTDDFLGAVPALFPSLAGADLSAFTGRIGVARPLDLEIAPIPLPAAGFMLLAGLGGLVALRRRKAAA